MKTKSQLILDHAFKDAGLKEAPGKKSSPRISDAIRRAADWLSDDDSLTAWCGCIRGLWGLETGTGVPSDHYRAVNWCKWGRPAVQPWKPGDTVILKRPGGYHVALFVSRFGPDVRLFGGNQSDQVKVSTFKVADVVEVRR